MIKIISPRIHNLGDFMNCLPALSGFYNTYGVKISLTICDRLQRFRGIKELLMHQEMFHDVKFLYEESSIPEKYIILDDTGPIINVSDVNPHVTQKYASFINVQPDPNFELKIEDIEVEDVGDKAIIGDRWSPKDAPDVDERRYSNMIESEQIIPKENAHYLDYSKDLSYNLNLIKKNKYPLITTFTGIGILADLMKKDLFVLWGDDVRNWNGKPVQYSFDNHYYKNRGAKLVYVKDFQWI